MIAYLWFPKHVRFSCRHFHLVVAANTCPDQRRYRRLTYSERVEYERNHGRKM